MFIVIENSYDYQEIEIFESELEAKDAYNKNKSNFDHAASTGGILIKVSGNCKIYSSIDWSVSGLGEIISSYDEDNMDDEDEDEEYEDFEKE
jgi:hypothetical protein